MSKIFDRNHISNKLSIEEVSELKAYYYAYHRKCWAYKQAFKNFKRKKYSGNAVALIFGAGGFAAAIASGVIGPVPISTVSLLIKG